MTGPVKITLTILVLTLVALGGLTVYRIFSSTIDNTDYVAKGDTYFQNQQYSNALSSYQKALDKDANNAKVYIKIASIYETKNRYKDALDALKKGFNIDKKNDLASIYYTAGDDASKLALVDPNTYKDLAINYYQNAASNAKDSQSDLKNFAQYKQARLISSKAGEENINAAKNIYSLMPDFQPAQYELVLFNISDPDAAISALNNAQKLSPAKDQDKLLTNFATWNDFAKSLSDQLNTLKTDIASKKSTATILNSKGYVAYKVDRCEFGTDFLASAITESEKEVFYPQARLVIGECFKRLQKYDEAKNYVEPVYKNNSDSVEARLILRQVYKGLNDVTNMKKMYEELTALRGQDSQLRYDYANDLEDLMGSDTSLYPIIAAQYSWLGLNLTDQSTLMGFTNTDFSQNKKYIIKAYEIFTYKVKDYNSASDLLTSAQDKNAKFIDATTSSELEAWLDYQRDTLNKSLEDTVYNQAKNINDTDALYHTAVIAKARGDKSLAQDKALAAFDKDANGYVAALASQIMNLQ